MACIHDYDMRKYAYKLQDYDDCNHAGRTKQTQWAPSNHHPSHVVKESPTLQYRVYRPESLIKAN